MSDILAQIESSLVTHINEQVNTHAEDLPTLLRAANVPGLSFVTFKHGEIDAIGVYGLLDATDSREVCPDTLFQAASISKSITALLCLRLVEAGILDLDADVNPYLKSWHVPATDAWRPKITLRQLLSHTAATTVHGFWGYPSDMPVPTVVQILSGEQPANNPAVVVNGLPEHSSRYSGGGTTIVQLVMTDVTDKDLSELAQEWVFGPLEMTDSGFMQPPTPETRHRAAHAHYYDGHPVAGDWHVYPELAAAGLWTTPIDLSKFVRAIQAGKRGEHSVVSQTVVDWMFTPVVKEREEISALGVFLSGDGDDTIFQHGGSNVGFQCLYSAYADGRGGFAVMTNSDEGWKFCLAMGEVLSKFYGGNNQNDSRLEKRIDFGALLGEYKNDDGEAHISQDDQRLLLQWNGQPPLKLKLESEDEFSIVGLKTTIKVERDTNGSIVAINVHQNDTVQRLSSVQ